MSPFELAFGAFKIRQRQRKPDGQKFKVIMKPASDEKDWFLAVFSGKGGGDGQKMMRVGDNGGDPWKVARARQGLACSGSAAETNLQKNLPHPSTSEVGRFLRKRLVSRHGPPQRSVRRRHGPLGDRSLCVSMKLKRLTGERPSTVLAWHRVAEGNCVAERRGGLSLIHI